MLEQFKEFRKDFSERIRSPFVSALIISWSIYNWKIYYLMLYNSEVISLEERISNIDKYLDSQNYNDLICYPTLAAICALIALNIAKSFGLAIKLLYDNWASPYIQLLLYNTNIIEKPLYEETLRAYNRAKEELAEKNEKLRELNDELESQQASFDQIKYNSIETHHINTSDIFDVKYNWANIFQFPDSGQIQTEEFTSENNHIKLSDGEIVEIKNRSVSNDGFIYVFEKHFKSGKILRNIVLKDKEGNYQGIEAGEIKITYKKLKIKPLYMIG